MASRTSTCGAGAPAFLDIGRLCHERTLLGAPGLTEKGIRP
jgi:hypothetical protein